MTTWDFFSNTHIKVVPKEEREKGKENIFEDITAENFPNLEKETDIQIQEAQTVTNRINPKIATPKYIVIKTENIKDKENIKSSKGKSTSYIQGNSIKAISWLAEILQARREWHDIFKVINGENLQSKNTYLARLSFRFDGKIKSFADKQKLEESSTTNQLYKKC